MKTALRVLVAIVFSPLLVPAAAIVAAIFVVLAVLSMFAMALGFMVEGKWKWEWIWER